MTITFGTSNIDLQTSLQDQPGIREMMPLGSNLVLSVFPPTGENGMAFSVHDLDGNVIIGAQLLDDTRFIPGDRTVEEQYIYGALVDGDTLTLFFMEQGFDQSSFSFQQTGYVREYSLSTGQALGPSSTGDTPALFTPWSTDTLQTSNGLLAVASNYGLTLMDSSGSVVGGASSGPTPGSYQNPNSFDGHAVVETGGTLMVFTTITTRGGSFGIEATSAITGQLYALDGTALGGSFQVTPGITHPVGTTPEENFVQAATLSDGRIVVVVPNANGTNVPPGSDPAFISILILNDDGTVSVPWFDMAEVASQQSGFAIGRVSVQALDNGGFVVGYNINGSSAFEAVAFQVFDASGNPVHDAVFVPDPSNPLAAAAEFAVLNSAGHGLISGGDLLALAISVTPPSAPPPAGAWTGTPGPDFYDASGQSVPQDLDGLDGNDTLYGGDGDDLIDGGGGNDILYGNPGNDTLLGGIGFDLLRGGLGDDSMSAGRGADRMYGGYGDDTMFGDEGQDQMWGDWGADVLDGGIGRDTIFGGFGNDLIYGGADDDLLSGDTGDDTLFGGINQDVLIGGFGNDSLHGGLGDDRLIAGSGEDFLFGGQNNDTLLGGIGSDTLNGGTGDDVLWGQADNDVFIFASGHGNDTIRDFDALSADEVIDLTLVASLSNIGDVINATSVQGTNLVIDTGGGNSITLINVSLGDLDSDDFIFAP